VLRRRAAAVPERAANTGMTMTAVTAPVHIGAAMAALVSVRAANGGTAVAEEQLGENRRRQSVGSLDGLASVAGSAAGDSNGRSSAEETRCTWTIRWMNV
jgi:hypothetical protein